MKLALLLFITVFHFLGFSQTTVHTTHTDYLGNSFVISNQINSSQSTIHTAHKDWLGNEYIISQPLKNNSLNLKPSFGEPHYTAPKQSTNSQNLIPTNSVRSNTIKTNSIFPGAPPDFRFEPTEEFWNNEGIFEVKPYDPKNPKR